MARAIWSGYLSFGLVTVPVALYPATVDRAVDFHQLHAGTSHRIRYRKVDEISGDEVTSDQIERGFELGDGEYVVLSRDELNDVAPGKSESIEISDFVDLGEIDPIHFRQSYYLAARGTSAARACALLRHALHATAKVGIATIVLRDKEHLVAIRPGDEVLIVETMYFADEIRAPREVIPDLPVEIQFTKREIDVAVQLVNALTSAWEPDRYHDLYRDRVLELIETKREGREVVRETEAPKSNVVDLMAALQASVEQSQVKRSARATQSDKRGRTPRAASKGRDSGNSDAARGA